MQPKTQIDGRTFSFRMGYAKVAKSLTLKDVHFLYGRTCVLSLGEE